MKPREPQRCDRPWHRHTKTGIGHRCIILAQSLACALAATSSGPEATSWSALDIWRIKCGWTRGADEVDSEACWVYTGRLQDPLTGQVICAVQGVELIQGLASYDSMTAASNHQRSRYQRRCPSLPVAASLPVVGASSSSSGDTPLECGSVLSRKLFCYTETDATSDIDRPTRLLESYRKRHGGPTTRIPFHQAVSLLDSAVSIISQPDDRHTAPRLLLQTQRPGGTATWSSAQVPVASKSEEERMEYSVHAQPSRVVALADWLSGPNATAVISPRRVALVQLGGDDGSASRDGTGAREVYSYRTDRNATCWVRYTRYGEAPVWYGPGRWCQLELTGQRLTRSSPTDRWTDLIAPHVPVAAATIQQHVPRFWSLGLARRPSSVPVDVKNRRTQDAFLYYARALHSAWDDGASSVSSADDYHRYYHDLAIGRAMARFRPCSVGNDEWGLDWDDSASNTFWRRGRSKLQSYWNKLRAASTVSIGESD